MVHRLIRLPESNSFFLFGPRGTGKTTLLHEKFDAAGGVYIDLLDPTVEDVFARDPRELQYRVDALSGRPAKVVIDEIQKVPKLLDLVHKLIEETPHQFVLTGSSARKLKRGVSDLLAGRAFVFHLFALTSVELRSDFDLNSALRWGTLPKIFSLSTEEDRAAFLRAYALTYLQQEIKAEQIVRNLDPFRQFLEVAAQCNGRIINYSRIARDVGVDTKTVQSYFTILEDTLIGTILPAYHSSVRKRQNANPKFYFFDTGVKRALQRLLTIPLVERTYEFGAAFEHFVINEIMRLGAYRCPDWQFSYLRTKDDAEIDLIIDRPGAPTALIEIKSTETIRQGDTTTLARFADDFKNSECFCFSRDPNHKKIGPVTCVHWQDGLGGIGLA
jgi:predicted AAA+ superfamily ATPase